jgi:hypothetical protein
MSIRKGMPVKKEIIYPIFFECSQFAADDFWESIFEDLAYSKTPYGTYISKDFLCCNYKNKEFSYKIENKDPQKLYKEIYNLLANKFGLLSQQDKIKKRLDFSNIEDSIKESRKTWANIRKKNVKDLLIEKYVIEMKYKHSLSVKQARYLLSVIVISMIFKIITVKDIIYKNGKIEIIEGINFENKKIIVKRDIYSLDNVVITQHIVEKKIASDTWDKYLKELRKMEN